MPTSKNRSPKSERGVSASKRVEAHLRHAIHAGKLRPRQRIIEEDLAQQLAVSRGPVREALLRLERDGLVVTTSRRGTFIRDISLDEIGVIFRMRAKLEGLCVRYMRENPATDYPGSSEPGTEEIEGGGSSRTTKNNFSMPTWNCTARSGRQPISRCFTGR